MRLEREVQQQLDFYSHPSSLNTTTTTHEVLTMVHTSTVKEVIHYSWDNHEVGRVKFHDSIVELTYFGKTHFLPLSHPLTYAEFYTGHPDPNNWKYNTIGCFLVSGKEI